ncbi:MAG: hypothetical protein WA876_05900 [Candidatus Acidiferrales bacterium]
MAIPPQVRTKFYALRLLALVLLVFPGWVFIFGPHASGIRLLATLGIFFSLWIVQRSNAVLLRARGQVALNLWLPENTKRVGPLAWTLAALSVLACIVFYYFMYLDNLHGGNDVWPVYAFAGAALALILTCGYVVVVIFRRIG